MDLLLATYALKHRCTIFLFILERKQQKINKRVQFFFSLFEEIKTNNFSSLKKKKDDVQY